MLISFGAAKFVRIVPLPSDSSHGEEKKRLWGRDFWKSFLFLMKVIYLCPSFPARKLEVSVMLIAVSAAL